MEAGQVFILTVIFLATFTRSTFGFGDALVAMPLLTLALSLEAAAPLVALTAITISTTINLQLHLLAAGQILRGYENFMIDLAANKFGFIKSKTNAFLLFHSCGSVYEYVPSLIEAGYEDTHDAERLSVDPALRSENRKALPAPAGTAPFSEWFLSGEGVDILGF